MRVEKKVTPDFFAKLISGNYKFDIRLADFLVNPGDVMVLREWDPEKKEYTGQVIDKEVVGVIRTKELDFWSKEDVDNFGLQIISFE
jgi:Domain of unknown function (DUF3850)